MLLVRMRVADASELMISPELRVSIPPQDAGQYLGLCLGNVPRGAAKGPGFGRTRLTSTWC